ncbi:MAG: transposase [Ignavibacteriaceae bacterium]|nr:transposase [Ignavibacteriaceae bacterium]
MITKKIDYHAPFEYESFYHIYNRGNNKENLFYEPKNYTYFLENWKKYLAEYLDVYTFCLLPNHFHFLSQVKPEKHILSLSKKIIDINILLEEQFRRLFITYSQAINKAQNRTGSLFQKRFKRIKLNRDEYFYRLVHYIHYNPVHHRFCNSVEDWKYSSFKLIKSNKPTLLKRKDLLNWFGGLKQFLEFHKKELKVSNIYPFGIDEAET